jgi:hypothetical protein
MPITFPTLKKYVNKANIFVETGTHVGSTVRLAIQAGFKQIYTIELAKHFYQKAVKDFAPYKHVHPIFGDSAVEIPKLLKRINKPCVFWLDGHWSEGDTALGPVPVPLYFEIDQIAKHHIKTHTILVDDTRLMGNEWKDISLEKVKKKLLKVNKDYNLIFEDGFMPGANKVLKNDILVATL